MFTLNNILSVARGAIAAQQTAVQVASNNIANTGTEGYSRQRVVMRPGQPIQTALGPAATGVRIAAYERMRDPLMDVSFRRDEGKASASGMRRDLLREMEGVFGEPSESGIGATMDAFWAAWDDLANDPLSDSARGMVRQRAIQLTTGLHNAAAELDAVSSNALSRLRGSVEELNDMGAEVARLNAQIVAAEAGGASAPDLRDARDQLIDRMAGLANVRVTEQSNGSASVFVENTLFIDGADSKTFGVGTAVDGSIRVELPARVGPPPTAAIPISTFSEGSALNEALRVINSDVPAARAALDNLAASLVQEVNAVHAAGYAPADGFAANGVDFFDPANVTASSISLSAAVDADASAIATSSAAGQSSDNAIALRLADLRNRTDTVTLDAGPPPRTASFGGAYRDLIADIARETRSAEDSATVFETLVAQTDTRRASVSGVSVDEELISLMQHQQAYVAATRVVSAVDEMLRDLLGMVR
jgi:flagellar hook-associated protein 1 FlgK